MSAKSLSPPRLEPRFVPYVASAAGVGGMRTGFGRFAADSIGWQGGQACAAAGGIPIRWYGDALDFWRVVGLEQDRSLSLRAEMRLPGQALLDFRIGANGGQNCTLRQTALFEPRGLFGLIYWYAVLPLHGVVFRGMLAGIQRDAVQMAALERVG